MAQTDDSNGKTGARSRFIAISDGEYGLCALDDRGDVWQWRPEASGYESPRRAGWHLFPSRRFTDWAEKDDGEARPKQELSSARVEDAGGEGA